MGRTKDDLVIKHVEPILQAKNFTEVSINPRPLHSLNKYFANCEDPDEMQQRSKLSSMTETCLEILTLK